MVIDVPFKNTFHEFYRRFGSKFKSQKEIIEAYHRWKSNHLNWILGIRRRNPNAIVIELHTTPDVDFARGLGLAQWPANKEWGIDFGLSEQEQRAFRKLRKWQARISDKDVPGYTGQVEVVRRGNGWFYAEVPAKYRRADERLQRILQKSGHISKRLSVRFTEQADLNATKSLNYLDKVVIKKLAHVIDTAVNMEIEVYRKPRSPSHRGREKPKETKRRKPKRAVL